MKCSICKKEIDVQVFPNGATWKEGHNAMPINDGRCCTKCNNTVVIRARIERTQRSK